MLKHFIQNVYGGMNRKPTLHKMLHSYCLLCNFCSKYRKFLQPPWLFETGSWGPTAPRLRNAVLTALESCGLRHMYRLEHIVEKKLPNEFPLDLSGVISSIRIPLRFTLQLQVQIIPFRHIIMCVLFHALLAPGKVLKLKWSVLLTSASSRLLFLSVTSWSLSHYNAQHRFGRIVFY